MALGGTPVNNQEMMQLLPELDSQYEELGCEVIVQLINGKEVTEYKDDVVICE